jgi:hypothetical protein
VFIGHGRSSPAHGEEDDGDGEARRGSRTRRRHAEKDSAALLLQLQRPFVQRQSNEVARLASRTSPAMQASTNQSEREGEMVSGR